ncbi:MAG: membrane protein insertion efficiency factor YidD [Bryobacteraceae bacterium]
MVDCHQSTSQSARCPAGGSQAGSGASLSALQWILTLALSVYKVWVSPLLPSACRYRPTCSEYMREAIARHGVRRGIWMGLRRLGRCRPFHHGGFDPVP